MATFTYINTDFRTIADQQATSDSLVVFGTLGTITDVSVGLIGLQHTYVGDLDMLLIGPGSLPNLQFWSDVGLFSDLGTGTDFIIEDGAPALPFSDTLVTGTFGPSDYEPEEPEIGADYGLPGLIINSAVDTTFATAFGGGVANGAWFLYITDDVGGDSGSLDAFSLTVTTNSNDALFEGTSDDNVFTLTTADQASNAGTLDLDGALVEFRDISNIIKIVGGLGDDMFLGEGIDNSFVYGDFQDLNGSGFFVGGDDTFTGVMDVVYGDVALLSGGARLIGGNDTFTQTFGWFADPGFEFAGDAFEVNGATLIGGDDVFVGLDSSAERLTFFGDTALVKDGGVVIGGNDTATGTGQGDSLFGDANSIASENPGNYVMGGNDTLSGEGGNDYIVGDASLNQNTLIGGDDELFGGEGSDDIFGDADTNSGTLTAGNDTIFGGGGDDEIFGDVKIDTGTVRGGDDVLYGDAGADQITGGGGADSLYGGTEDDSLYGGDGNDYLDGGTEDDSLYGGRGGDSIYGGDGNDFIEEFTGDDIIDGGDGTDLLYYEKLGSSITVNLMLTGPQQISAAGGMDTIINIENLVGSKGGDNLTGNNDNNLIAGITGNDRIFGLGGNDIILGGANNDTLRGNNGDDTLIGGQGRDFLGGGAGSDVFLFGTASDSGLGAQRDRIQDFEQGLDTIDLFNLGELTFIGTDAFDTFSGGSVRVIEATAVNKTIIEIDLDGDNVRDMQIELTGNYDLLSSDFVLLSFV